MATKSQILRKLQAYKKNPELIKEVSNTELADLVLIVMRAVETIEQSMESKRVDVEKKYDSVASDLLTQSERQNRDLLQAVQAEVKRLVNQSETALSETTTELEKRVQQAIENIRNGEDGIVSDEEIERAANIAVSLIELPDFEGMMTEAIQGNGALIRDALESLPEGEEQLAQESVRGLVPRLKELQERIERISTTSGGTIGKNQVYGFIAQAIADGTIPAGGGGSSTFTDLTDTPAAYTSQGGKLVRVNTAEDALEFIDPPSGTGDVSGPASAVNEQIAVFDGTTGKLIKDGGATIAAIRANTTNVTAAGALMDSEVTNLAQVKAFDSADYATAAQGDLADSASQPGHTHVAANITDFDTEVANNSAVAANTAKVTNATHTGDVTGATALTIANNAVTNAKAADMATSTIKGRATAGTGNPEDLTATQVRTLLNVADGATANSADATLLARANHTGTQTASTISDFDTEVANNSAVAANTAKVSYPGSANATELNILDGATVTTAELNVLDGITATTAELNHTDGVTSNIQTQIDGKAAISTAINAQTGTTYTLVLADANKNVTMSNASANTLTVPPNSSVAFPVGTKVLVTQSGAGSTTIAAGAGVTINAPTTVTLAIGEQHESRGCLKTGSDTWTLL